MKSLSSYFIFDRVLLVLILIIMLVVLQRSSASLSHRIEEQNSHEKSASGVATYVRVNNKLAQQTYPTKMLKENKKVVLVSINEKLPLIAVHDPSICTISEHIVNKGYWEEEMTNFFRTLAQVYTNDFSIIDIGANIGWFSMMGLSEGKTVFSFEPSDFNIECMNITLQLNPTFRKKHHLVPFPVSDYSKKGTLLCFKPYANNIGDNFGNFRGEERIANCEGFLKKTKVIDEEILSFFEKGAPAPIFLKADIEGFELPALKGAERIFDKYPPCFVMVESNGASEEVGIPFADTFSFLTSKKYTQCKKNQYETIFIHEKCEANKKLFCD